MCGSLRSLSTLIPQNSPTARMSFEDQYDRSAQCQVHNDSVPQKLINVATFLLYSPYPSCHKPYAYLSSTPCSYSSATTSAPTTASPNVANLIVSTYFVDAALTSHTQDRATFTQPGICWQEYETTSTVDPTLSRCGTFGGSPRDSGPPRCRSRSKHL